MGSTPGDTRLGHVAIATEFARHNSSRLEFITEAESWAWLLKHFKATRKHNGVHVRLSNNLFMDYV